MTTGDGGMICSDDMALIRPLKSLRWLGIDKDTWRRAGGYSNSNKSNPQHWYYEISSVGYKLHMNDLAATIGLAQLKKLDWMNRKRRECVNHYMNGIRELRHIMPLLPYDPNHNSYHIFGVRCQRRDDLILHLKSKGIATGVHYLPLDKHPYFRQWRNDCPNANAIWETFVTLPLYVDLKEEEVEYILDALREFDKKY